MPRTIVIIVIIAAIGGPVRLGELVHHRLTTSILTAAAETAVSQASGPLVELNDLLFL